MSSAPSEQTQRELVASIPNLRAFALSLSGNVDRADDLVQETLVKAWHKLGTYEEGTNLKAWLFTILRNAFYSDLRKYRRELADVDGEHAMRLATHPEQLGHLYMGEMLAALEKLPEEQCEAVLLVGAEGFAYEEAAEICGCAVGTIKSRVNRARHKLAELMHITSEDDFGPDRLGVSVMTASSMSAKR